MAEFIVVVSNRMQAILFKASNLYICGLLMLPDTIKKRTLVCLLIFFSGIAHLNAQCTGGINGFPYNESFENSDGGWLAGGAGNDWAWGTPSKPVISAAGGGSKCWIVGGLSGSAYTNSEASWLQSPCFDFTGLQYPYIECKINWETEQQFDGASLQYSTDDGASWSAVGSSSDASNCLNSNWFNNGSINYLSPLTSAKQGWSGNIQPSTGSCRGGSGSNGWLVARHTMPYLAGKSGVLFRFIFGAGTICNNYDGFGVDDIKIGEAPANAAGFTFTCGAANTVNFTNTSALCPAGFSWDFGDPVSGATNSSTSANPSHVFSAPGTYNVKLTVSGPGNAPSSITQQVNVIGVAVAVLTTADCLSNRGGSLKATVSGSTGPLNYSWNTSPVQTGAIATDLGAGTYTVNVSGAGVCQAMASGELTTDLSCIGIYFPTGFTPNNNGMNDFFGPLGSIGSLRNYRFAIYNRWGERVFYTTSPYAKWDGKVNGQLTDGNVFVWKAEFDLPGQAKQLRKGTVILIR